MSSISEQFLKRLYKGLKYRVPLDEAEDIIRDYREFFEEEKKLGKNDEQISAALGSPKQVIKTLMAERKLVQRPMLYLTCFTLAIVMASFWSLFLLLSFIISFPYNLLNSANLHAFVILAPLPALLLYCFNPTQTRVVKGNSRLFYWGAYISGILLCVSSVILFLLFNGMFTAFVRLQPWASKIFYMLLSVSLVASIAWISGIFGSEKLGRYVPSLYFICAAVQASVCNYIDVLANMNFEDPTSSEAFLWGIFSPVPELFIFAAAGAAIWCGVQYFPRKLGGK